MNPFKVNFKDSSGKIDMAGLCGYISALGELTEWLVEKKQHHPESISVELMAECKATMPVIKDLLAEAKQDLSDMFPPVSPLHGLFNDLLNSKV